VPKAELLKEDIAARMFGLNVDVQRLVYFVCLNIGRIVIRACDEIMNISERKFLKCADELIEETPSLSRLLRWGRDRPAFRSFSIGRDGATAVAQRR